MNKAIHLWTKIPASKRIGGLFLFSEFDYKNRERVSITTLVYFYSSTLSAIVAYVHYHYMSQ